MSSSSGAHSRLTSPPPPRGAPDPGTVVVVKSPAPRVLREVEEACPTDTPASASTSAAAHRDGGGGGGGAAEGRDPVSSNGRQERGARATRQPAHTHSHADPNRPADTSASASAPAAASAAGRAPPQPQPQSTGESTSSPSAGGGGEKDERFRRPALALSAYIMPLYKHMNANYCRERRRGRPGRPVYNNGYDDAEGHYVPIPGEEILDRYTVQDTLGQGSFGVVLRCYDMKRKETVALKITRRGSSFRSQARLELDILLKLNENPQLHHLVVKLLKVFDWQEHLVLVFELLSSNLYQLIRCTGFNGISLDLVRKLGYQLVLALVQLEAHKPHAIIHCDLKPENILLRSPNRSGIRLIDFGSACFEHRCIHRYIQSRFYRSPEVILYLPYSTAIDRWSLGCLLVELHTGAPLFDGRTEAAQLARFEATLGPIPHDIIAASSRAGSFYTECSTSPNGYRLKDEAEKLPRRSLEEVLGVTTGGPRGSRANTPGHDPQSYWVFLDFITGLLRYRPEERLSCAEALQHPFLSPLSSPASSLPAPAKQPQQTQGPPPPPQPSAQPPPPAQEHHHP